LFYLLAYMVVLNSWVFILMGLDKKKAQQQKWRIPEKRLLILGLIGGGLGGLLGMYLFEHKSRKLKFKISYFIGVLLMLSSIVYLLVRN
jgi:uncharacterized membrane protein YsdA (DUF1294 family)